MISSSRLTSLSIIRAFATQSSKPSNVAESSSTILKGAASATLSTMDASKKVKNNKNRPSKNEVRSFRGYVERRNNYAGLHEVPQIVIRSKSKEELDNKLKVIKEQIKPQQSIKIVTSTTPTNAHVIYEDVKKTSTSNNSKREPIIGSFLYPEPKSTSPKDAIKSGRSWYASEIRQKSMTDLHSLWFVLLAERNKLLSERFQCRKEKKQMQGFERLKKVKQSMARIMTVIRERELEAINLGLPKNAVFDEILTSANSIVATQALKKSKKIPKSKKETETETKTPSITTTSSSTSSSTISSTT